jgi:hypothetical protein
MRRGARVWLSLWTVLEVSLFAHQAHAEKRVALVIGNGVYQKAPELPNPPHDATDITASLQRLGFLVRSVMNASFDDMRRALLDFGHQAADAEMAIAFFAGHGMEIGGENWLIPVDAELRTDTDVENEAISLKAVMLQVSKAHNLGLVILDACRNNPFAAKMQRSIRIRAVEHGFNRVEPTDNVLVAYAAKDGTTANDGDGRNSPFTSALLRNLETPGLEIRFLLASVRDDVIAATNHEQQPFVYGSLSKEIIYLKTPSPITASGPLPGLVADEIAWGFLKNTTDVEALRRFIGEFPTSARKAEAETRIAALKRDERARSSAAEEQGKRIGAEAVRRAQEERERVAEEARKAEEERKKVTLAEAARRSREEHERRWAAWGPNPVLLGQYDNWGAYGGKDERGPTCFILAKPVRSQATGPHLKRESTYLMISSRPTQDVKDEVSVLIGYQFKKDSDVTIEIGSATFTMSTQNNGAWIKGVAEERRLVDAMHQASDIVLKGTSQGGTQTNDTYLLTGLARALDRAAQECR